MSVTSWGKWTWFLSMLEWRAMVHQWWGAFDSKATACHAWDLWRVLYLLARQCSCSQNAWDNQPSETRHLRLFHQTFATQQHRSESSWLRCGGQYGMIFLQISWRIQQCKTLENQPTFVKVVNKYILAKFFDLLCICTNVYQNRLSFIEDMTKTLWLTSFLDTSYILISLKMTKRQRL